MNYLEFKKVYNNKDTSLGNKPACLTTFIQLQKLFDDNLSLVYLNKGYEDTLWYKKLLNKFVHLVEETNNSCAERIQKAMQIYKSLFVKCAELSAKVSSPYNNNSNFLYKTA